MPVGCLTDNSGERLNGIQEVSGSIPLISTKEHHNESCGVFFVWNMKEGGPRLRMKTSPKPFTASGMFSYLI